MQIDKTQAVSTIKQTKASQIQFEEEEKFTLQS